MKSDIEFLTKKKKETVSGNKNRDGCFIRIILLAYIEKYIKGLDGRKCYTEWDDYAFLSETKKNAYYVYMFITFSRKSGET